MVYDAARKRVVLFGGEDMDVYPWVYKNDTWVWDGRFWVRLGSATSPGKHEMPGMAYDAAHRPVILFRGVDSNNSFNDTWAWDGSVWAALKPTTIPPSNHWIGAAYAAARQRVVAVEWSPAWEWDGTNWTPGASSPPLEI